MESVLAVLFKPMRVALLVYGISVDHDEPEKSTTHSGIVGRKVCWTITKACLTILTFLCFATLTLLELIYFTYDIDIAAHKKNSDFEILVVLNGARFSVSRVQEFTLLLLTFRHRRKVGQLFKRFGNRLQTPKATHIEAPFVVPLILMTFLIVFLCIIPECVVLSQKSSSNFDFPYVYGINISTEDYSSKYKGLMTFSEDNKVLIQAFMLFALGLHGSVFLYIVHVFVIALAVALTVAVRLQIRNADDLSQRMTEAKSRVTCLDLLLFRRQCRALSEVADEVNTVLSPLLFVLLVSDVAMLLGSVSWLFNPVLLSSYAFRHLCWLGYLMFRTGLLTYVAITSTETVRRRKKSLIIYKCF
ncbi:hypothetical protein BV898_13704 [Hypsibius exemplaris]|uniref:Uncharacterized protein n=1 Tax=Hypsibius exemplaris TaxID=2072580 RepID=A0A1W0WA14_HYPEX|nr:hypothetical protein BV898_13704 [Hypsibius exemplaris]